MQIHTLAAIPFPDIDPIIFQIGFFALRWYSLAYMVGFLFGWWYARKLVERSGLWANNSSPFPAIKIDDAIIWAALAGILGGRLFYVVVYNLPLFMQNPLSIFKVWEGGMAFHGGILGAMVGLFWFAKREKIAAFSLFDLAACVAPVGIFLGRLANFINAELWGRVSDAPWAIIFPNAGGLPRHPSQLYQAFGEGVLLFIILNIMAWRGGLKRPGLMAGLFGVGYGCFRFIGEFFREPDPQLGFLFAGATMGQLLCLPLIGVGFYLIKRAYAR